MPSPLAFSCNGAATKDLLAPSPAALGASNITSEVRLCRWRSFSPRSCSPLFPRQGRRLDSGRKFAAGEVRPEPDLYTSHSRALCAGGPTTPCVGVPAGGPTTPCVGGPTVPRRLALLLGSSIIGQLNQAKAAEAFPELSVPFSPISSGWNWPSTPVSMDSSIAAPAQASEYDASFIRELRLAVRKALKGSKGAAGALRLPFHDAFTFDPQTGTGGMNGSIIYELDRPESRGLKAIVRALKPVKELYDQTNPVSWADLISIAGAEAVEICGGPAIPVELGRIDAREPDAEGQIPPETIVSPAQLKSSFRAKTFTVQEMVALCGAHTIGGKGFGDPVTFDNVYFQMLLEQPWNNKANEMASMIGLPTDRAIAIDEECLEWIRRYASDQDQFFSDFRDAYIKLVNLGVKRSPITQQSA